MIKKLFCTTIHLDPKFLCKFSFKISFSVAFLGIFFRKQSLALGNDYLIMIDGDVHLNNSEALLLLVHTMQEKNLSVHRKTKHLAFIKTNI